MFIDALLCSMVILCVCKCAVAFHTGVIEGPTCLSILLHHGTRGGEASHSIISIHVSGITLNLWGIYWLEWSNLRLLVNHCGRDL